MEVNNEIRDWYFLEKWLPDYSSNAEVAISNDIDRYIQNEYDEEDESDLEKLEYYRALYPDIEDARRAMEEIDEDLFERAEEAYRTVLEYQKQNNIPTIEEARWKFAKEESDTNNQMVLVCASGERSKPNTNLVLGRTLLRPSPGTNFIYEVVVPEGVRIDVEGFNAKTYSRTPRIKSRIKSLSEDYGARLEFRRIQSECFDQNLRTIDGDLPKLLARLLLIHYEPGGKDVKKCTELLTRMNPLGFDTSQHGEVYEYKVKRFLQDSALGMVPETAWTGLYDATGGEIIVKEDGEVVCYHIYQQNQFKRYLFEHTKFESAATSEDAKHPGHPRENAAKKYFYGWLYEQDGQYYIKLNLQVRFKKGEGR